MTAMKFKFLPVLVLALWLSTPAQAMDPTGVVDQLAQESYAKRKPVLDRANAAAQAKNFSLEALGKACSLMPIRIGAVLTGQAPLEKNSEACLETQLGLQAGTLTPLLTPPVRWHAGAIYRLHEAVEVYGPAIQRWFNEHFGDAILSAIDFSIQVEETKGSHGERRIRITFDGKALPYSDDEGWTPPKK